MTFLIGGFRLTNFGDFRLTVFGQFNPTLTIEIATIFIDDSFYSNPNNISHKKEIC